MPFLFVYSRFFTLFVQTNPSVLFLHIQHNPQDVPLLLKLDVVADEPPPSGFVELHYGEHVSLHHLDDKDTNLSQLKLGAQLISVQ